MWERQGQELEVALWVRSLVVAEDREAPTNARTLVKQQMEALGLSSPGLRMLRWRIADAAGVVSDADAEDEDDPRSRLTVVSSGVA